MNINSSIRITCLLLAAILLTLPACKKTPTPTISPIHQDITEMVFASGSLDPDERYNLTAQTDGYLTKLSFKEGDQLQANQLVALIDNKNSLLNAQASAQQLVIANTNLTDQAPALQQIQANIDFAQKKIQQDKTQTERYKKLYETNSVAKIEYENTLLALQNSEANLAALQQQYKTIQQQAQQQQITQNANNNINLLNTDYNKIKTLQSGKVLKRYKQNGDFVRRGDVVATIGNTQTILAKLNVDENSIAKISVGQKAIIQLNVNKDKKYNGIVQEILPMFDDASQSFICKVAFTTPLDFTTTGTQLEANILVGEKKNALLIPRSYMNFGNKVYLKDNPQPTTIQTGIVSTEWVEVISGLNPSDQIVLHTH
jgi:multidrug efflux pump subunit AcrA (membrane-fusion protein)